MDDLTPVESLIAHLKKEIPEKFAERGTEDSPRTRYIYLSGVLADLETSSVDIPANILSDLITAIVDWRTDLFYKVISGGRG